MEAMDNSGEKIQTKDGPENVMSPTSSSSPSQSSADRNFEPTIDMMVNDFDDDETLQEEEAIAALEYQNPQDEIDRLREESEMPIEELLALYGSMPAVPPPVKYCGKKRSKKNANASNKRAKTTATEASDAKSAIEAEGVSGDVIVIESGDEEPDTLCGGDKEAEDDNATVTAESNDVANEQECDEVTSSTEIPKKRRTHLMDLYPEENFNAEDEESGGNCDLDNGYNDNDEEDEETDEDDVDSSYIKKTIMVGTAYQAAIPIGLSQYGDVLPYENEDKLVWEPSQVSEREVEDYLLKASEIKPTISENNQVDDGSDNRATASLKESTSSTITERLARANNTQQETAVRTDAQDNRDAQSVTSSVDGDGGVVKDNEQALHLLVQCGYDFKEALRRKRLNAVLTGSMSLWSEDECSKFEEGIQKFGKDFLKIRQNQVRTRTMRELVQFYYLWKKSERRDQNFANSNTVDHMDIYLNEGSEYGGAGAATQPATSSLALNTRKSTSTMQNNFSILTGSSVSLNVPSQANGNGVTALINNNRRRSTTGAGSDNQNNINSCNRNDVSGLCATGK